MATFSFNNSQQHKIKRLRLNSYASFLFPMCYSKEKQTGRDTEQGK